MQTTKRVKNPRKQRKMVFNAPAHRRHKMMAAPLSTELAASKGAKTMPVRKGDTIRIMRGDNKGFEGKVSRVDLKAYRIYIEGLTREKVDGTNIFLPVHPSKVQIRNLTLDDNRRKAILQRKATPEKTKKEQKAKAKAKAAKKLAPEKPKAEPEPEPVEEEEEAPEEEPEEVASEDEPEETAETEEEEAESEGQTKKAKGEQ
jgi:large subunit ribosomal protein L24